MSIRHARTAVAILLAFLLSAATAGALDVAAGRMRLTLDEQTGRFSLSAQTKGTSGIFVPLLAAEDPRTTTLSVVVGNKVYRMGESGDFVQTAEKTPTGARFTWKSPVLQVTESFSFTASADSTVANGVRVDISLKNLSEQDLVVGVRYLFDTYLGESSFVHFRTPSLTQITKELVLPTGTAWWSSPLAGDADEFGLQVMTAGQGITTPDKVVFANWKRLSDVSWDYDVSAARNFSQLPYSINDSAVSQYYSPRAIPRGGEATVSLVLGIYSKTGFTGDLSAVATTTPATTTAPEAATTAPQQAAATPTAPVTAPTIQSVRSDLTFVDAVLARITAALDSGGMASDAELSLIESTLRDLQARAPGGAK